MSVLRCRCVWRNEQCPNDATQEDGLCDWCGKRRPEDIRNNPKAMIDTLTNNVTGLGGAGELHQRLDGVPPTACWLDPALWPNERMEECGHDDCACSMESVEASTDEL